MSSYRPPVVISVHGIRTHGRWQKKIGSFLGQNGILHDAFDYGRFGLLRFFRPSKREEIVDLFYEFYGKTCQSFGDVDTNDLRKRPSVIAHSFGTYVVGYCMLKYDDVRFDKVVMCGGILPDFDWITLLSREQWLNLLKNEYGVRDSPAGIARLATRQAGSSGKKGFLFESPFHCPKRFDYHRHGCYFKEEHMRKHWLPFLQTKPSGFRLLRGGEIASERRFSECLNQANRIDEVVYQDNPLYEKAELPRGLSLSWIRINPDIYTFLIDRAGRIKGYIDAIPVSDEVFERIKRGEIIDNQITADDVVPYSRGGVVKLYLMSIAIAPDARNAGQGLRQEAFEKLSIGLVGQLVRFALERHIRVEEVVAVGWTETGRAICRTLNITGLREDDLGNVVYHLDLRSVDSVVGREHRLILRKLSEVYRKEFRLPPGQATVPARRAGGDPSPPAD